MIRLQYVGGVGCNFGTLYIFDNSVAYGRYLWRRARARRKRLAANFFRLDVFGCDEGGTLARIRDDNIVLN